MRRIYYAGIGSRETPLFVLNMMTEAAKCFAHQGKVLRSGRAIGADQAFERGAGAAKEIFLASDANEAAIEMASRYHPAWGRCKPYARQLHGRNCQILLGRDVLNPVPVTFVLCWTKDGQDTGGTGQAIRVAWDLEIPVFNLYDPAIRDRIQKMITGKK